MDDGQIEAFLKQQIMDVPLPDFIGLSPDFSTNYIRDNGALYDIGEKNGE